MRTSILLVTLLFATSGIAQAQRTCDPEKDKDCIQPKVVKVKAPKPPKDPPVIWGGGISMKGKLRAFSLVTFLERADEELERAALQRRSFVPELVRTVELEKL